MENSKMEKAKVFTSKIPRMKTFVKPSNKPVANNEIEKAEDVVKHYSKGSALIQFDRRLTQAAGQSQNKKNTRINWNNTNVRQPATAVAQNRNTKTAEGTLSDKKCTNMSSKTVNKKPSADSLIVNTARRFPHVSVQNRNKKLTESSLANRRNTNISAKTVSKKTTAESTEENKAVNEVKNQNNYKKQLSIVNSNMNRRHTNVNKSKLTNDQIGAKKSVDFGLQNKELTSRAKQQTARCSNEEIKFEKVPDNLFVKPIQGDSKLNQGSSSSIQGRHKTSIPANEKNLNHFSQSDIEFVADERFRQQILCGKELSPIRKPLNKVKFSSIYERHSFFKSSQAAFDINTAIKRLEEKGRRESVMKMNRMHPASPSKYEKRESFVKLSQTPFDINAALKRLEEEGRRVSVMKMSAISSSKLAMKNQQPSILKSIENVNHASESCRASLVKRNPLGVLSPRLERDRIHERSATAYETALKRVKELELKNKVKCNKKVTFNLETSDSTKGLKSDTFKTKDLKNQPPDNSDENHCLASKLVPETPVSKPHLSTESTDKVKRNVTASHYNAMLLRICGHPGTTSAQNKANFHLQETASPVKPVQSDLSPDKHISASSVKTLANKDFALLSTPTLKASAKESPLSPVDKISIVTHSVISHSVEANLQTYRKMTNSIMASSALRSSLYLSRSQAVAEPGSRRNTLSRLCTPKPVSFYPRTNESHNISPEFMGRRTSCIVANAPISTPMVLRNLAESFEETLSPCGQDTISPVCQRLDFDKIAKETDDDDAINIISSQECDSSKEIEKRPVQNIFKCINIMDSIADQECCKINENAGFSLIFERRLLNPVAQILSHGDDMHFVPLKIV